MVSCPSAASIIAGTLLWGLPSSLSQSPGVSTELLLVEEFDFDILLNFNLNGATFVILLTVRSGFRLFWVVSNYHIKITGVQIDGLSR